MATAVSLVSRRKTPTTDTIAFRLGGMRVAVIHELAHYRVGPHRRAFVREMALVYQTWLEFLRESGTRPDGGS
jgi:hypothetical protein